MTVFVFLRETSQLKRLAFDWVAALSWNLLLSQGIFWGSLGVAGAVWADVVIGTYCFGPQIEFWE